MSTASSGRITTVQRYLPDRPCPICGGSEKDPRGQGSRCVGFLSIDGEYARCSREEHAGDIPLDTKTQSYPHRLKGSCKCGREHGRADPKPGRPGKSGPKRTIVATYQYVDEDSELLFEVVRYSDKTFHQRRPTGDGKTWHYSLGDVRRVLYRLPEIFQADPAEVVYVVEGEKDADRLKSFGLNGTCNPGGAGKWRDTYSDSLAGRIVHIIPDNDDTGRKHAESVASSLLGKAAEVKVLDLAAAFKGLGFGELPHKGDISDFFDAGAKGGDLRKAFETPGYLIEIEAERNPVEPLVVVTTTRPDPILGNSQDTEAVKVAEPKGHLPSFGNHHVEAYVDSEGRNKTRPIPHPVQEIDTDLEKIVPGWPKRVQERLFIERDQRPVYLNSPPRFFSWIDRQANVDWTKGSRFIPQERYYEHKRMTAEQYRSIEIMPHVPPMPGAFYMHEPMPPPSGKLDLLLDRFLPNTEHDRQLIKAMIATPLWGGRQGARPAFLVTGPDFDTEQGRGLGKTTLIDLIANELYGGAIDVSPGGDDMPGIKTRLFSAEGETKRILRLDNIKTLRFSWADLEAMISSEVISGKQLYVGEGNRLNCYTWILTLNGASLSTDMAQRTISIKLSRPSANRDPKWRDDTAAFMRENRWEILSDVAEFLARPPGEMSARTRWAAWESAILSKLVDPEGCQKIIAEREDNVDEGKHDRDIVRDAICERFKAKGISPDLALMKIASSTMAEIVSVATRKHYETAGATTFVKGLSIGELIQTREGNFRGWIWNGEQTTQRVPEEFVLPSKSY